MTDDNKNSTWEERREEIRRYFVDAMGKEPISVPSLERYNPDALEAFFLLRKATLKEPPEGTLSKKVQELIIIAVESALKKDAIGHARIAVDAGATPQEIHDAVGIVLWLAGMPAYHHGMRAVAAAEEYLKEKTGA